MNPQNPHSCPGVSRRSFLADTGMGFTGLVLGSLLFRDGTAIASEEPWQPPDGSYVQLPVYDTMRQLLTDFYTPPTENQLVVRRASLAVYNGSGNTNWDRVAAERLAWDGFAPCPSPPQTPGRVLVPEQTRRGVRLNSSAPARSSR